LIFLAINLAFLILRPAFFRYQVEVDLFSNQNPTGT
jgi:hypothetical protein